MNVQNVSTQMSTPYTPNFKGAKLDKALELVTGKNVCKKMTNLDFISTQMYIKSLAYKIGITPEEVAALTKFNGDEFFYQAYDFLTAKLGLSKKIRPVLELVEEMPNNPFPLSYMPSSNYIYVDLSKTKGLEKQYLFAALRHELQHFLQAADIHRHETLSVKMANMLAQKECAIEKAMMDYLLENCSAEQIKTIYAQVPAVIDDIFNYKSLVDAHDTKLLDLYWQNKMDMYLKGVAAFQSKVKAELGIIKADSSLTSKIERNLQEFEAVGYLNKDGSVDMNKYYDTNIEDEAIISQVKAQYEFEGIPCGVRQLKAETLKKIIEDEASLL